MVVSKGVTSLQFDKQEQSFPTTSLHEEGTWDRCYVGKVLRNFTVSQSGLPFLIEDVGLTPTGGINHALKIQVQDLRTVSPNRSLIVQK